MFGGTRDSEPLVLLAHDGELDDVRTLLCEGGAGLVECRGAPLSGLDGDWTIVVATPQRVLELGLEPDAGPPRVQVAIGESDSKTLRRTLSRLGVDYFVRRPVHPEALRLLLLHVLYRGPEKRRARRVQVGAWTHYRSGLRKRPTVLVDLSIRGCRLLLFERGVEPGERLTIYVPTGRDGDQRIKLRGEVVRFSRAPATRNGRTAHVSFETQPDRIAASVQRAVDAFADGPGTFEAAPAQTPSPRRVAPVAAEEELPAPAPPEEPEREGEPPSRPVAADPEVAADAKPDEGEAPEPPLDGSAGGDDRRTEPRRIFTRRVVALREDQTRVLIGRDLSSGGMRTDPDPNLQLGDELSVALPLRAQHVPLVVKARVVRDDAERGLVLRFLDLSEKHAAFLRQHANLLPICDSPYSEEEPAWVIASEIVDP